MQIQQGGVYLQAIYLLKKSQISVNKPPNTYKIENAMVWKESDSEEIAFSFFLVSLVNFRIG